MGRRINLFNGLWYLVENITAIAFSLLSVFFVARYFGPENLGKLSLVQSASSVFLCFATLGLDHFVVRDLARNRDNVFLLGSIMSAQFIGWIAYSTLLVATLWGMGRLQSNTEMWLITFGVIATTFFSRAAIGKLYFQAINAPKTIAVTAVISRAAALIYIFCVLHAGLPYEWVLMYLPIQAFVQWGLLLFSYQNSSSGVCSWRFDFNILKRSLCEALPVMLATAAFPIFMQADILVISHLMSDKDAGIYSAAMRVVVQFVFVGHVVVMTFYAALSASLTNTKTFERLLSGLIKILSIISFMMAGFGCLFSDFIVDVLYGAQFSESAEILSILVWVWVFVIPASLYSRLLILQGHAKYELIKSLVAALLSLTLNFIMIPYWGLSAAAFTSVICYFVADFAIYMLFKDTRYISILALSSIFEIFTRPVKSYSLIASVFASKF